MYLEVLKREKRFGLYFCSPNDREKGKTSAFSSYQLRSKLCLDIHRLKCNRKGAAVAFGHQKI